MAQLRVSRRSFLAASAIATLGTAAGGRLIAGQLAPVGPDVEGPAQVAADPIADLAAAFDYDVERIHRFVSD
ncbi:MAG: twin-arginine translocation signal domain-containing protein, partial [Candidatus Limnocylindrales bacterium]